MKKITINRTKQSLIKDAFHKSSYAIIFFLILLALGIVNIVSSNKFTTLEGVVETMEVKENDYRFTIKDNKTTYEFTDVKKQLGDGQGAINSNIVFQIVPSFGTNRIVKVDLDGVNIIDIKDNVKQNSIVVATIAFVLAGLLLIFILYRLIRNLKKPLTEDIDYVEMMLTKDKIITNQMFDTTFKVSKISKIFLIIRYVVYFILLVHILFGIIFIMGEKSPVTIGIIVVIVAVLLIILPFIHPYFYSKQSKVFTEDYLKYLNEGSIAVYYNSPFTFKKEGLKYERDNKVIFSDYHELNLYCTALYSRNTYAVNLFICSDQNIESPLDERVEYIIPLTHKNYQEIKDNNIEIRGLEYIINHLNEEIVINNKKVYPKYKVKKYLD